MLWEHGAGGWNPSLPTIAITLAWIWKGMKNGPYEIVKAPENFPGKKYRGHYCYEHRLVWWRNTGSLPDSDKLIHHINGKKRDNRFENLSVVGWNEHSSLHHDQKGHYVKLVCPCCGDEFIRLRRKTHLVKPNKATYCSRSCIGKMSGSEYDTFDQVIEEWKE